MQRHLAAAVLAACALPATANELGTFYELGPRPDTARYAAGFAVLSVPRYDGADSRRTLAVPALSASWANGVFADPLSGVGINFGTGRSLQWGLRATLEAGRSDNLVSGLDGISARLNPGVFANWRPAAPLELRAALRAGMAGNGKALHLGATYDLWQAGPSAVSVGGHVRWVDAAYNQAYYGLTAAQSAATGLPVTTPGSGVNAWQLGASARTRLAERWTGFAAVGVQRLVGDAADSPLVRERRGVRLLVGAGYSF